MDDNFPLGSTCPTCLGLGVIASSATAPSPLESHANNSELCGANYVATLVRQKISDKKKADAICAFLEEKGILSQDDIVFYASGWKSKNPAILALDSQLFSDQNLEFVRIRFHSILEDHLPAELKRSPLQMAPAAAAPSQLTSGRRRASDAERASLADALNKWRVKKSDIPSFNPLGEWILNNYLENGTLKRSVLVQLDNSGIEVACPLCTTTHRLSTLKSIHTVTRHIAETHLQWARGQYPTETDETSSSVASPTPKRKKNRVAKPRSMPATPLKQPRLEFASPSATTTTVTAIPPALPLSDSNMSAAAAASVRRRLIAHTSST